MSQTKFTVSHFQTYKNNHKKIAMLTAYDYATAKLLDDAGIHAILVGDSLGMVMLGYENTLCVTMEDMLHHTKAVRRGTKNAFVLGDMPYLSYHIDKKSAVKNAGRFIQEAGADGVKLEGGKDMVKTIKAVVKAQIPVMGHLGLTPQSVNLFGGFKVQGRSYEGAKKLIEDALYLQEAGVFGIVLECIPAELANLISQQLDIPTIGIGAGAGTDGQVLVIQDMLGMYDGIKPKFVKEFATIGDITKNAAMSYKLEMEIGVFPGAEHTFKMDEHILEKLKLEMKR